ncbi:adenylosuccinate synthase [Ardenticatena maritima]|uniref:Adenylosuccinate synthetase n=1 Tax=Ardenticatena maritima TaxID=872965 RepID=A0A0M8K685_9CHLR|nr:adenylosuccinate synthase [Ardenticatena maritima]KPL87320.1 adenylosuccinate synthetase [Ardenticatena maritima]GAP62633.1 adenylosuccinate synthase [Ardenticatena maritima]
MPGTAIIGAQWGDEGKGKITHLLSGQADVVVRFSGGPNAGHTVVHEGQTFKLHQIPSGVLYPHVYAYMGNGMVIDPDELLREMQALRDANVDLSRLVLSGNAHLIFPYHRLLDRAVESARGDRAIGTTGRGIGPAYTDKAARRGIRARDLLLDDAVLAERLENALLFANAILSGVLQQPPVALDDMLDKARRWRDALADFIGDAFAPVHAALQAGQSVLFEGAQGTLLDLDHGTYPYVTSSHPTTGGVLTGAGVGVRDIQRVIGVVKAFQTRVGGGPMPTELHGEEAVRLRGTGANPWDEFGTTTGRPRRVGWLDGVALRYSAQLNGLTELAITKLDILSGLERIPVAVAYELDGERLDAYPAQIEGLERCRPIYETVPGWQEDITNARTWDDLPQAARDYLRFIEDLAGAPVTIVSVGPGSEQTIWREA